MMRIILLVGALSASIACASGGKTATGVRHDSELIAEQEVTSSNGTTAYEVISRTRPAFYNARDAINKFGTQIGTGVIDISTK
jgi:hypothetical protein